MSVAIASNSARLRGIKNSLAKWLITIGGISVLFTLVLIFLYLLYVIKPIFEPAKIELSTTISLNASGNTLEAGVDELKEVAYQINDQGVISFYQLKESVNHRVGSTVLSQKILPDNEPLKFIAHDSTNKFLFISKKGTVQLIATQFKAIYDGDVRTIVPNIVYPLAQKNLILDESPEYEQQSFKRLAFAMDDEKAVFIGFTSDNRLIKTSFIAEDDFSYDSEYEAEFQELNFSGQHVDKILISPDLSLAFVLVNDEVAIFDIADDAANFKTQITPVFLNQNTHLTSMALLSGGSSLLLGDTAGQVSQWFEISTKEGRRFKQIRSFSTGTKNTNNLKKEAITAIYTEQFRKSFYTMSASGNVEVFYTTSNAYLWQGKLTNVQSHSFSIAPRADGLVLTSENSKGNKKQILSVFTVHNEHPEVTWEALWQEVWYEGYPEPDYVWQSTSGSDDFEGKFSLVPISFGTMKAALYAMLFAVPVALTAAIYTAYFMTPNLRRKVKPTIEMMEALPTVILGFLAGLWLAPLMEEYLPAIFLLFFFLPLSTVITAFAWHNLPRDLKIKIPETLAPLILIPVLIFAGYCAFILSPILETTFFGGDMRQYITNDLGINFDQRNALVVGIAMGFAVIPTIFSMAEDAIFSVPGHLTSGSLALGATQWQTLAKVVLLTASPGIFSAVMMGLGRAVGETMIVLMATGNTPILDWSIFQGMRTLAANIAVEMPESEVGSSHYRILFLAAFVLFVFTFIFNTVAEFVRQHLREKYSSM